MGGRVRAGSMYLVNESGSELFIPDQTWDDNEYSARTAQLMRDGSPDRTSALNLTINDLKTTKLHHL